MEKDKKQQLLDLVKQYVDENKCINITQFRLENPNEYALLPHYFGTVNQMIEQQGWIKVIKTAGKEGERVTLRNQLAYDMIKSLRDKGTTLEEIAQQYGVTRPGVNQLYKALGATIEKSKDINV